MLGKLVQLRGVPMEDGFRVIYGLDFGIAGADNLNFAILRLPENVNVNDTNVIYCRGLKLIREHDSVKDFMVDIHGFIDGKPAKEEVEECLWIIIPYSTMRETTAKQIAGRYPEEAILEMKAHDTLKVSKGGKSELYMVIQAGNELFLVKKNR